MYLDERTCRYFQMLVQEKNISRAAEKLYISQPSLSKFLMLLEEQLAHPLFERNKNGLVLTEAGRYFLSYIHESEKLSQRFEHELSLLAAESHNRLRFGMGPMSSVHLVPLIPGFQQMHPQTQLEITEDLHDRLLEKLFRNELDVVLAVFSLADSPKDLCGSCRVLYQLPRLLVISRNHPLARLVEDPEHNTIDHPQYLPLKLLEGQCLLTGIPGQKIYHDVRALQQKHQLAQLHTLSSQNLDTSLSMVRSGLGIHIVPSFYLRPRPDLDQYYYFYSDDPLLQWQAVVLFQKKRPTTEELDLAERIQQIYQMPKQS